MMYRLMAVAFVVLALLLAVIAVLGHLVLLAPAAVFLVAGLMAARKWSALKQP